ncbi:hypothetical protein PIB30_094779, partial [Stylosanthes scabra]|nr:hypothetical protein [Stylosanthes scabra]
GTITLLTYYYLIRSGALAGGLPDFRKDFGSITFTHTSFFLSSLLLDQMADRKRKGKVVSSSSQVPRFKTLYHEAHFKSKLSVRKVLLELIIQVDESILDPCGFQIQQRKWERFTKQIQAVGHHMVKEFYANAWEPNKEKRKPYTYTSMVRGKDISFAPSNIKRVLKLRKDPIPNAALYHERKANKDYGVSHVARILKRG